MQSTDKEGETILSSHKKGTAPGKIGKHLSDLTGMGPFLKKQMSSLKKGTAPNQTDCCVISQERDRSLKNKLLCHLTRKGPLLKNKQRPQSKLSQKITQCEWISGTLSQHVAWLCDSRFLSQGVLYHPKRGQAVLQKDIQTFFLLPWRLEPFCTIGDDPRQARSCSSEFCP